MATSGYTSIAATSQDTLKFSWSLKSQSVANNTSTIEWELELIAASSGYIQSTASKKWSITVNGTKYSGTNTIGISNNATKTLASGTTTIAHNSDGTKTFSYSFSQELAITWSSTYIGTKTGSGSGTLTAIPRKSTMSVANGTLGTAQTLTVSRADTSFTHTIVATCGSKSTTICTKSTNTSISFTPPLGWASENTTGSSVSVKYSITTYNGSTEVGSNSYTVSCAIPSSVAPSVSFTYSDSEGYSDVYGGYIQNLSKVKIAITARGSEGSTITAYKTEIDGKTYTASSFTSAAITKSGTLTIRVTVTDSRGKTAVLSRGVEVLEYVKPKITSFRAVRCNSNGIESAFGDYIKITFNATASKLGGDNNIEYELQYKKLSDSEYNVVAFSACKNNFNVTDYTYIIAAEKSSSYEMILSATDNFVSVSKKQTGSSTRRSLSLRKDGRGAAVGKTAENRDMFECEYPAKFNYDVYGAVLGLGYAPALPSYTDINTVTTIGMYGVTDNNIAASNTNMPVAKSGRLIVSSGVGRTFEQSSTDLWSYLNQIYCTYDGQIFVRAVQTYGTADTWNFGAWKELVTSPSGVLTLENNSSLRAKNSTGVERIVFALSSIDEYLFGYGSYANNEGTVYYDGNTVNVRSKNTLNLKSGANVFMYNSTGEFQFNADRVRTNKNDVYYLGDSSQKWKAVYAVNGTIQTSDRNQKENILDIGEKYEALFDRLQPVTFELKGNEHDRVHVGFIAQDVKEAMDEIGLTDKELAAYCVDTKTEFDEETEQDVKVLDENGEEVKTYSLRYTEFIALNTHMIQKQKLEIDSLKNEIAELKALIKGTLT